ncbi:MAG TPA: PKD domain-containing protein [Herpetosiphonaceae bacterium]
MGSSTALRKVAALVTILAWVIALLPSAMLISRVEAIGGVSRTYTSSADFNGGDKINVVTSTPDQLQLDDTTRAFNFIWVAVSTKGTVVKIDTDTGAVLGEYWTSPEGQPKDPSRTTVDKNGSVWTANRQGNSVVHIGLLENGQCDDRNGNGAIETSTGYGDIRTWSNAGGADTNGGVTTAADECIIHYTRVNSSGTRHVSVTADNDVWVSGTGGQRFDLLDGDTGQIIRSEPSVGYGGYGGLIDQHGVIWSSRPFLRWDTALPLTGPNGGNWLGANHDSYGLCIDSSGNVWNTALDGNQIRKFAPNGTLLGTYSHGNSYAQGCVIDRNNDVWVAHSILGPQTTVGHIKNNGTFVGNVTVGSGPTGVAVDAAGKIWATNYYDGTVSRIDPNAGPIGADGATRVGAVDFTSGYLGGNLYNYSDMTGSTLFGAPDNGTWTVVYDSTIVDARWGLLTWNGMTPGDSQLTVTAASSADGITFGPPQTVNNGDDLIVADGQYLKIGVAFARASSGESPILYDLTLNAAPPNSPPTADAGGPYTVTEGSSIRLDATASDPDGNTLTFAWSPAVKTEFRLDDPTIEDPMLFGIDDITDDPLTLLVTDPYDASATGTALVTVRNANPVVTINGPASGSIFPVNTPINFAGSFTDAGILDTHTGQWTFDGVSKPATIINANGSGTANTSYSFATPGVYRVKLTVTDDDNGTGEATTVGGLEAMVVIYDPNGGFVTGGGWINSPRGAYVANPDLEGRANFGFVSKYQKGATTPTGETEFQFKAGDLNFHSSAYEWLVIAGARAQYKGTGTINGTGSYGFMLTAIDGQVNGGGGVDKFRMKIWDKTSGAVVYDNQLGAPDSDAPSTVLGGGAIVIHSK